MLTLDAVMLLHMLGNVLLMRMFDAVIFKHIINAAICILMLDAVISMHALLAVTFIHILHAQIFVTPGCQKKLSSHSIRNTTVQRNLPNDALQ